MGKKVKNEDDFENDEGVLDDIDDMDEAISACNFDVRRQLERIREDKELERLINGNKFDDFF